MPAALWHEKVLRDHPELGPHYANVLRIDDKANIAPNTTRRNYILANELSHNLITRSQYDAATRKGRKTAGLGDRTGKSGRKVGNKRGPRQIIVNQILIDGSLPCFVSVSGEPGGRPIRAVSRLRATDF